MFDADTLFKARLAAYIKETSRYLKYIFNGHIAIALLFLITALAVYYQQWLEQLAPTFPAAGLIALVLGILASYTPVKTLLVEPDLVFLIPAEHKMKRYFNRALIFSFIHQLLLALFVLPALSPLYFHTYPSRGGQAFLFTVAILFIVKAVNLIGTWWGLKKRLKHRRVIDQLLRLSLNMGFFFFLIQGNYLVASLVMLGLLGLLSYQYLQAQRQVSLAWELLIEQDQHQMAFFYRIANLFTDVPHLKKQFRKRLWLTRLVSKVPFAKKSTYDYLYRLTFVRSGDYLRMYLRLIILGGVLIYFVPNEWMKLLFALLFIYMSSFQLVTLYQHYRTTMWLDLYPTAITLRQRAFVRLLYQLTFLQIILFGVLFLVIKSYVGSLLTLLGGAVFIYLFMTFYVKRKVLQAQ